MTASTPEQQALTMVDLAREGRFDEIRRQFAPVHRRLVTTRTLRAAWDAEVPAESRPAL